MGPDTTGFTEFYPCTNYLMQLVVATACTVTEVHGLPGTSGHLWTKCYIHRFRSTQTYQKLIVHSVMPHCNIKKERKKERKYSPSPLTGQASKSELAGIIVRNYLSALTGHASKSDFGIENSKVLQ